MKYFYLLFIVLFCLSGCGNKTSDNNSTETHSSDVKTETDELAVEAPVIVDIEEIKVGMENRYNFYYEKFQNSPRISDEDRLQLKIDSIKNESFSLKVETGEIVKGNRIYDGEAGKIETIFVIQKDHMITEYLISYDKNGNYVDFVRVGQVPAYYSCDVSSVIKGNKIKCRMFMDADEGYEESIEYHEYEISPQLKFIEITEK
ncbi:hypothetical protein [Dysgonomonas sp. 520]|uniref:hypothetical protein n=1 Tax=Dysgonomonas sp. 520 TaxID=2302931 RepID=UPI0013D3B5DF|nr:hypothetical protein [Dysgonomonas sp. 520]NDW08797.1 hypothetical protein [Dysgonomonas sp. 520]